MTKIDTQTCSECSGTGLPHETDTWPRCWSCHGTGVRHVPRGYSQGDLRMVRDLVDAMAVRPHLCG